MKSMAEIDERVPKPTVSWTQIYITEDEVCFKIVDFGENPQKQTWNSTLRREFSLHLEKGERKARRRA